MDARDDQTWAASPLTVEERAELEAENRILIAKIKRLLTRRRRARDLDDAGNMGVFHSDFVAGWDGVTLKPPPFVEPSRLGDNDGNCQGPTD